MRPTPRFPRLLPQCFGRRRTVRSPRVADAREESEVGIDLPSRKTLWARAGDTCAFPGCPQRLTLSTNLQTGKPLASATSIVGEEAHIRSPKEDGPRYDSDYPNPDGYENLVLLCPTHHTAIDNNGGADYSVGAVERMKIDHEDWVDSRLGPAGKRARDVEILLTLDAARVEEALFGDWESTYWRLAQPIPFCSAADLTNLVAAGTFLLGKDWPTSHPKVAEEAERLRRLIAMLVDHIHESFELDPDKDGGHLDRPEKRLRSWDPPGYDALSHQTELNMVATWWLVDALAYELNDWIRAVREELDPTYRFSEGWLLVPVGDGILGPVRMTRFIRAASAPVPRLPATLDELIASIEAAAKSAGETPQYVNYDRLEFGGTAHQDQ